MTMDITQAFNNNPKLQQFLMTDVTYTGRVLGKGSFGSVVEVMFRNIIHTGKEFRFSDEERVDMIVKKYLEECELMSRLHHPNITHFYGVCFVPNIPLPLIVTEWLEVSLNDFLSHSPNIHLPLKHSLFEDVASGLLYLHKMQPHAVVHMDINTNNILLTSRLARLLAKITDVGNCSTTTGDTETSIDIFHFGHVALYTLIQRVPSDEIHADDSSHNNKQRGELMSLLQNDTFPQYPDLTQLVMQCLHSNPHERPQSDELLTTLQKMRGEVEKKYGSLIKHDLQRVKHDVEIKRLIQQKEKETQLKEMKTKENAEYRVLAKLAVIDNIEWKEGPDMPFEMGQYVQSVSAQGYVYVGGGDSLGDDGGTANDNDCLVMEYNISAKKWGKLPPIHVQAEYLEDVDIQDEKQPPGICYFTMTVIKKQLVLIGGYYYGQRSKQLVAWEAATKEWTRPYPEMNTARSRCSAAVYKDWLVVAGGWSEPAADCGCALSSIEVLNCHADDKKWYEITPTPVPWVSMRAAVVDDMCYFMGGYTSPEGKESSDKVYCTSLAALSHDNSQHAELEWKIISTLKYKYSTPLSIGGQLLVVGGFTNTALTRMYQYRPDSDKWVELGTLPTPLCKCSCVLLDDGQLVVAGGNRRKEKKDVMLKTMYIADKL